MKSSIFKTVLSATILVLTLVLTSCSSDGIIDDFSDMFKLRDSLKQIYPGEDIHVNISNGSYINISFVNSDLKKMEKDKKEKMAENVGKITEHFFKEKDISQGSVTFVLHKNYIIYKYTESIDSYDMKLTGEHQGNN